MIRDDEINRLVKYAEALGVKVVFADKSPDAAGEWAIDGSEITIFKNNNTSKTETVISLVHEIGHHCWFIHEKERTPDLKFDEAITRENLVIENKVNTLTPKKLRKKILDCELESMKYWEVIWKDTNIKIPKWRMYEAMEFDSWVYKYYYRNGVFPSDKECSNKTRALRKKHKGVIYE